MSTFYDIHFHAMNLSHPNLLALLRRLNTLELIPLLFSERSALAIDVITATLLQGHGNRVANLLSVMENDIGSQLLMVEAYLKQKPPIFERARYDKIVLAPLIIDFGYQHRERTAYFYNLPPRKPVTEQTIDLFNGIRRYCEQELNLNQAEDRLQSRTAEPWFEIYPFLGINTRNYSSEAVEQLLHKYFADYTGHRADLHQHLGQFRGDLDTLNSNFFAGIKLYPPVGFDPWPEEAAERQKVEQLYTYCEQKQIPITVHCGQYGYNLVANAVELSSPQKWKAVLEEYSELKLNLAHFGQAVRWLTFLPETTTAWERDIIALTQAYPYVYTDFSFRGMEGDRYYAHLARLIEKAPWLEEKVLFGSDFMINLLEIESYNAYLQRFSTTPCLTETQKQQFCTLNPEKFLFHA